MALTGAEKRNTYYWRRRAKGLCAESACKEKVSKLAYCLTHRRKYNEISKAKWRGRQAPPIGAV